MTRREPRRAPWKAFFAPAETKPRPAREIALDARSCEALVSDEGAAMSTTEQKKNWEQRLHKLLGEIEIANGERPAGKAEDALEARVRIAWEQAYEDYENA